MKFLLFKVDHDNDNRAQLIAQFANRAHAEMFVKALYGARRGLQIFSPFTYEIQEA